ncbi:peptide chain release factor 2 [Spirochaetota bacterium]
MLIDEKNDITALTKTFSEGIKIINIPEKDKQIAELEERQHDPAFWQDQEKAKHINIEVKKLKNAIEPWIVLEKKIEDVNTLIELALEEKDESQEKEIKENIEHIRNKLKELEILQLFGDESDYNNTFLSIHPGAGGTESCDWAMMLYRMYTRWVERRGYDLEVIDFLAGDEAGLKSATLLIKGEYAHGHLKAEIGVHRLVRISPFDANRRRHTSFCSINCVPEIDDMIEIDINPSDLKIDTYRAGGHGGQHVNTTDSAVRITHLPTGIVVTCQAERSQYQNKENAMKVLRARVYEHLRNQQEEEIREKQAEKKKIEWGSQIRSYVFQPYTMVKDHRTNYEAGNIQDIMDGNIEPFIMEFLKKFSTE